MAASPSPRVQAAAHYYQAGRIAFAVRAEGATHRDALARLAQTSDDAQVYAWAWRACRGAAEGASGACMQVTAAQWTRIDPDNAESWLAAGRGGAPTPGRRRARRRHVPRRRRGASSPGRAALAATVAEYTPQDERSLIGTSMAIAQAIGIEAGAAADWQGVSEYCSVEAMAEANRRETCERVASVLVDRSTQRRRARHRHRGRQASRLERRAAGGADGAAGRRRSTVTRLRGSDPGQLDPLACAAMRSTIERVRAHAEFGEIEMLRRDVAATGQSIGRLAAEARRAGGEPRRSVGGERASGAAESPSAEATAQTAAPKYFFSITGVTAIRAATKLAVKHTSPGLPGFTSRVRYSHSAPGLRQSTIACGARPLWAKAG